ncbi:ankyrin repeat domain-containing protein [Rhodoblastus sp.]|uniref:ankyrin repeat domain-containing protein n=1 Tax=Rhodoblastus sp. TaxID=1962975 RepID=UPI0026302094|nr:ankyrin repeat domain-containing protein [Rhodoblastus sp.]
MTTAHRYWVCSPDGRVAYGFEREQVAVAVALEYGVGAAVVDTLAQAYMPMLQIVERCDGELRLVLEPVGGWDTGRFGLDRDLIEAIKKGRVEIVHAFLAKGASSNAADDRGGRALHWAAARGEAGVVELLLNHGADIAALDPSGRSALAVAEARGKKDAADLLRSRGAR